jgi:hypothetical protein
MTPIITENENKPCPSCGDGMTDKHDNYRPTWSDGHNDIVCWWCAHHMDYYGFHVGRCEAIKEQGWQHGAEYAEHKWVTDPADYERALEWCLSAVRNKLDEHELPDDAADAIPGDLDTAGWSWGELAEYQSAWLDSYRETVTELCRNLIHEHTRSR